MVIKCKNIFYSKALQNLPKFGFLVRKQTIWQPWLKEANWRERPPAGISSTVILFFDTLQQDCQIFLGTTYQNGEKYNK
jgi:hypothetical protein